LYGIDGCRGGWVAAGAPIDLGETTVEVATDLRSIFGRDDCIVAIDIPIGISENEARDCDKVARQLLRPTRSSSVFSPPARRTLCAKTFQEALRLNRAAAGVGISKQAFHIMAKIREVDELMNPKKQRFIREVHPEVAFAQLNGAPLIYSKKQARGRLERIALLQSAGLNISDAWLIEQRARLGTRHVSLDDLIDALACLVTASEIRNGRSLRLGRPEQTDAKGLTMEIVSCAGRVMRPESLSMVNKPSSVDVKVRGT
jgi:predicted RNase H-like nuclease